MTKQKEKYGPLLAFGELRGYSMLLSELYDPDIHGTSFISIEDLENKTGKIVGRVGSIVIDHESGGIQYYVTYRDPTTYKCTLKPVKILQTGTGDDSPEYISIVDYGNEKFVLYFDDRVKPTKLEIDSRLIVFGSAQCEYRLARYTTDDVTGQETKEIISIYLDSDGKFKGNRIPLGDIVVGTAAKMFTNCHTNYIVKEGELVYVEVFNNLGIQTANIALHVLRPAILNDLASDANPIMKFDATCLQMRGEEWYIMERQDVNHLGITPYLEFADGSKQNLVIDGQALHLYGLENFTPSFPGYKVKLILKYFLNSKEQSPISSSAGASRYLIVEKDLVVVSTNTKYSVKISCIPLWDVFSAKWTLNFFAYGTERDQMFDVTPHAVVENFQPLLFNERQKIRVQIDLSSLFGTSINDVHIQYFWLTMFQPDAYQKYIIQDSEDAGIAFGVESTTLKRPIIHYDKELKQYFIPTSKFPTEEFFLDMFYRCATPPWNPTTESDAPTPTHFTIRDINGSAVITTPIEISQFSQAWNIIGGPTDRLVKGDVIVEFLDSVGSSFSILYGVPVNVMLSETGYNTISNP